jgi:hypothetical protein
MLEVHLLQSPSSIRAFALCRNREADVTLPLCRLPVTACQQSCSNARWVRAQENESDLNACHRALFDYLLSRKRSKDRRFIVLRNLERPNTPAEFKSVLFSDSAIGVATGYGLDDWGFEFQVPVGLRTVTSPYPASRLWGSSNVQSSEYPEPVPESKGAGQWSWLIYYIDIE